MHKLSYAHIWQFYHGDVVIFHCFDPVSKQYKKTEVGAHIQQFVAVIKPGLSFVKM